MSASGSATPPLAGLRVQSRASGRATVWMLRIAFNRTKRSVDGSLDGVPSTIACAARVARDDSASTCAFRSSNRPRALRYVSRPAIGPS